MPACHACQYAPENPDDLRWEREIVGGELLLTRCFCRDTAACRVRRLAPSPAYRRAYTAVREAPR